MKRFINILMYQAAAGAIIVTVLVPAACNTVTPVATGVTKSGILDQLLQNNSINVSLSGTMTFNDRGQNITSFREFAVHDIPITWTETTFKGNTTSNLTPQQWVIDNVHGVATADGKFLQHVSFWRIIKEGGKPDIIIDVTVYAIPMDGTGGGNSALAKCFEQTGDVKKYVLDVTYEQDGVQYVCTDWGNTTQPPVLKVQFGR